MKFFALFFLGIALLLAGCPSLKAAAPEGVQLTVMSYNIRIGRGSDGPMQAEVIAGNMPKIAQFIRESGADIVLLQEVDVDTHRTDGMNQVTLLGELTGMHSAFGKALEAYGGDFGVAILSRYPISYVQVHKLFKPDYRNQVPAPPNWHSEQRVAMMALVETPAGPVRIIATHLGFTEDQREKQLEEIAGLVRQQPEDLPIIFGGDLNTQPQEEVLLPVRDLMQDAWKAAEHEEPADIYTYKTLEPVRTIDYLFFSHHFQMKGMEVPRVQLSDHLPVVARVQLP